LSESHLSSNLIRILRTHFGDAIWLQKRTGVDVKGEPDISGVLCGRPFFFEVKECNPKSRRNTHPFSRIQAHELSVRERAGAFAVGALVLDLHSYGLYLSGMRLFGGVDCGVKYVLPSEIPENGIVNYEDATNLDIASICENPKNTT
jgi:hypothetical protein